MIRTLVTLLSIGFVACQLPANISPTETACLLACASQTSCSTTDIACLCANAGTLSACAIATCGVTQDQANLVIAQFCRTFQLRW